MLWDDLEWEGSHFERNQHGPPVISSDPLQSNEVRLLLVRNLGIRSLTPFSQGDDNVIVYEVEDPNLEPVQAVSALGHVVFTPLTMLQFVSPPLQHGREQAVPHCVRVSTRQNSKPLLMVLLGRRGLLLSQGAEICTLRLLAPL